MVRIPRPHITRQVLVLVLGPLVAALAVAQLVPYRVENPARRDEPAWDSPRTRALAVAACFDCHSNESTPYWWEKIAPVSWLITKDVNEGRDELNFSECTQGSGGESDDAVEVVRDGSMPPSKYTWFGLHGDADLSPAERRQLASGLRATLAGWDCDDGD